jgi:hypothetical protein
MMDEGGFHSEWEEQQGTTSTQALQRASALLQEVSDLGNGDEVDLLTLVYRNDLEALDKQISEINSRIKSDQEQIRVAAAEIEELCRTRSLLLILSEVMGQFVRNLESYKGKLPDPGRKS